jgi:hypothetical protein
VDDTDHEAKWEAVAHRGHPKYVARAARAKPMIRGTFIRNSLDITGQNLRNRF